MKNQFRRLPLAVLDICLLHVGFLVAMTFHHKGGVATGFVAYGNMALYLTILSFCLFSFLGFYSSWNRKRFDQIFFSVTLAVVLMAGLTLALANWLQPLELQKSVILVAYLVFWCLLAGVRFLDVYVQRRSKGNRRVLVVAKNTDDLQLVRLKLMNHAEGWFDFKNVLIFDRQLEPWQIQESIEQAHVVILSSYLRAEERADVISCAIQANKEVLLVPNVHDVFLYGAESQQVDDMQVFSLSPLRFTIFQRAVKRGLDIVVSMILLILTCPIMVPLLFLIPLTSPGPAIFSQERLGRNLRPYVLFKFRTMVQDAERTTGPVLARSHDPRITPIGQLLRSTRLDELPQLFNVLRGEMSLVGPRPERKFFVDQFKETMPEYVYRLQVKPGITGNAQVHSNYNTAVEDKLRYDLMYIVHYSFILDIKILLQTLLVVLRPEQAAGIQHINEVLENDQTEVAVAEKVSVTR